MAVIEHLPLKNEYGFYEIRLDSIGGLGAHLAGQILGEAAVLHMGLNALHFSSYGSEKKGSPIKSFVRFADGNREIRSCSPVEQPHLVAVFHDALLRSPDVLSGLVKDGILIINTRKTPEQLKAYRLPKDCHVYLIDALTISIEEKSRVNTAMMGAITKASGFLDKAAVLKALTRTFQRKHPSAVEPNEKTFLRGFKQLNKISEPSDARAEGSAASRVKLRIQPQYGYRTAPIGGCNTMAGSSVLKDISISRQGFLPVFEEDKCVQCGLCELVCPDQSLVWRQPGHTRKVQPAKVKMQGIDYRYCKGCMRCVEVCPSGALDKQEEKEGIAEERRLQAFPDLAL